MWCLVLASRAENPQCDGSWHILIRDYLDYISWSGTTSPPSGIGKMSIKYTFIPLCSRLETQCFQLLQTQATFSCPLGLTVPWTVIQTNKNKQTNSIKLLKSGYFIHSKGFQLLYNCHPSTDFILEKNNTITHKSAIVFSWEEIPEGKKSVMRLNLWLSWGQETEIVMWGKVNFHQEGFYKGNF